MNKWKRAPVFIFLFVAVALAYANSLDVTFLSDDYVWVCDNDSIRTFSPLQKFLLSPAYAEYAGRFSYRPLTSLSFAMNYAANGLRPAGYHVVNLLFHALNVFLVFLTLRRLGFRDRPSLVGALLFAVHPVHTEAVTWISGRGNVLFLFFFLIAYLLYAQIGQDVVTDETAASSFTYRDTCLLAGALIAYCLALMSKEMAVTLPALLFGHDIYFHRDWSLKQRLRRAWLYAPFAFVAVAYLALRLHVLDRVGQEPFLRASPLETFLVMTKAFAIYGRLLFAPVGLSLSRHFPSSISILDISVVLSICIIVVAVIIGVSTFRRSPLVSFSLYWFAVTMLPVSNIIPVNDVVAERFLYGPSIGFCILVACWVRNLPVKERVGKILTATAVTAVIFCHMSLTVNRNTDWRNPISLWEKTIKVCPTSYHAFNNLGIEYLKRNRMPEAISAFSRAVELKDSLVETHMNLAMCYEKMGNTELAIKHYNNAIASPSIDNPAWNHYRLAGCLERSGRSQQAIEHYEAAVKANPDYAHAHLRLGVLYRAQNVGRAIEHYEKALALGIDDAGAHYHLGLLYWRRKDRAKATGILRKSLAQNPRNMLVRNLLDKIESDLSPESNPD